MNDAQRIVAALTMSALTQDAEGLARTVNELPDNQVRDATSQAMALIVASLRPCFTEPDWQALIEQGRAVLLDLEMET